MSYNLLIRVNIDKEIFLIPQEAMLYLLLGIRIEIVSWENIFYNIGKNALELHFP
ncbi:MAG: hypothetical protein K6E10_01375 [Eubacterium sp.]|nr:hypothetical protein [Eubacterium sp.]